MNKNEDSAFITYIPAGAVKKIPKGSVVVSIKGHYDTRPEMDHTHKVFKMDFDVSEWAVTGGYGIKPEQVTALMAFIEEHPGENIYVHCTEGKCRSYTTAKCIWRIIDRYIVHSEFTERGQWLDRPTCNVFNSVLNPQHD